MEGYQLFENQKSIQALVWLHAVLRCSFHGLKTPSCGAIQSWKKMSLTVKVVKQCIEASLTTQWKEKKKRTCGANKSLSFNLIYFLFSFPPCLFVCTHDFGCCLSSGGMYTCSSPTLVHLSALRCFRWSAMLSFSISFFFFFSSVHTGCLRLSVVLFF